MVGSAAQSLLHSRLTSRENGSRPPTPPVSPPVSPPVGGTEGGEGGADEVNTDLSAMKLIAISIFAMNSLAIFIANS